MNDRVLHTLCVYIIIFDHLILPTKPYDNYVIMIMIILT